MECRVWRVCGMGDAWLGWLISAYDTGRGRGLGGHVPLVTGHCHAAIRARGNGVGVGGSGHLLPYVQTTQGRCSYTVSRPRYTGIRQTVGTFSKKIMLRHSLRTHTQHFRANYCQRQLQVPTPAECHGAVVAVKHSPPGCKGGEGLYSWRVSFLPWLKKYIRLPD